MTTPQAPLHIQIFLWMLRLEGLDNPLDWEGWLFEAWISHDQQLTSILPLGEDQAPIKKTFIVIWGL